MGIAPDQFGIVDILGIETERRTSPSNPKLQFTVTIESMAWYPGPGVSEGLKEGFKLQFICERADGGIRQILPQEPLLGLLLRASLVGHAILRAQQLVDREKSFSYHAMRLIFQKADHLQENLRRTFHRAQDLYLSAAERIAPDVKDVLPEMIGQDSKGQGGRWSVAKLMDAGRQAALKTGDTNPPEEECIRRGLWEAACLAPIDYENMKEDELMPLIRLAVFDLGPGDAAQTTEERKKQEELTERVISRLLQAIEKHSDHGTEDFHEWFFDKAADLVYQIAKQKKNGGPIERTMVRQVMLETIFRSFAYVGGCVHLAMEEIARCLPEPLDANEQAIFHAIYQKHPALGGLPLAVLFDQFAIHREAMLKIWDAPNDKNLWGTLLRYLQFHAEMVSKKRESERYYKEKKSHSNQEGKTAQSISLPKEPAVKSYGWGSLDELLQAVAQELRERRQANCKCGTTGSWFAELDPSKSTASILVFQDRCAQCGHAENQKIPAEQARELAEGM